MSESFLKNKVTLHCGDCLAVLPMLAENSIDACVTDPPYHLVSIGARFGSPNARLPNNGNNPHQQYNRVARGFMGQIWDGGDIAFRPEVWREVYRVLKPGAHLLAFGGTRTYHRMACAIEDAGFEIRDTIMWVYGSGFPKSHDVSKGIDRAAGEQRERIRGVRSGVVKNTYAQDAWSLEFKDSVLHSEPITDAARQWEGWGTALKPANEPVLLCSKPLTVEQHLAICLAETNARIMRWLDCDASDAANCLNDFQAKLNEAASTVLDGAKIRSLASIGIVPSAVEAFTFNAPASIDLIRTKASSVLSHVKQSGNVDATADLKVQLGVADDTSKTLMAMCTSVATEGLSPSIVTSWLNILDVILAHANTFTIETALKLTTGLKIWNLLTLPIISTDIGDLSPNAELICLARKPLSEKTVAENVLRWSTGALNIDGCRVAGDEDGSRNRPPSRLGSDTTYAQDEWTKNAVVQRQDTTGKGRWPANVLHDGSEEVLAGFPESDVPGPYKSADVKATWGSYGKLAEGEVTPHYGDSGSAARFFYTAKADSDDRLGSKHPTVKPLDLMQHLVRLVTPPQGRVLDPFAGTGTTGEAAFREGMGAVLIEREAEYQADIRRRMALVLSGPDERWREAAKAWMDGKPRDDGPLFGGKSEWDEMWERPFDYSKFDAGAK